MGVYKRGNRWYLRWMQDGQLQRRSLGPDITTKKEALEKWHELQVALKKRRGQSQISAFLGGSNITLPELRRRYLSDRSARVAASTYRLYEFTLKSFERYFGSGFCVANITSDEIDRWVSVMYDRGASAVYINSNLRILRAALNWAVKHDLLRDLPTIRYLKEPKRVPRRLTPEQVRALLRAETHPERRALWTFLLYTGCRRSEALGLRWEHITWEPHPVARVRGKGDKERLVPLLPAVVEALGLRRDVGPVFPRAARVHYTTVTRWFRQAARAAGIEGARIHDLRHTCFTVLASAGVSLRVIQDLAGHANIATTERYVQGLVVDYYEQMGSLERVLGGTVGDT